jgi:5-methyltetrahydropteroyltriglutamate--homocysteine methyltransferase
MPPFRAEHVGSLLRPQAVLTARADRAAGRISDAALRLIEDDAVRTAVQMQADAGMPVATDGEFRRDSWQWDFFSRVGGITKLEGAHAATPFRNEHGAVERSHDVYQITGTLRLASPIFGDDFAFLKEVTTATPKLSIPSPNTVYRYGGARTWDDAAYPDIDELQRDLTAVYAAEIAGLHRLGCNYLQLDDTTFAGLCDPVTRAAIDKRGVRSDDAHLEYIRLFNDAVKTKPAGMTICTHTCRGNHRSGWINEGAYDFIAEALFNELDVDGYFLEYDDERSGGFEPLRFVPKGKTVMLGLVTTKRGTLESRDALKRRIDEAAKFVPLEQLGLTTQCGFASTLEGNVLTVDEEVAKLRLIVETALEVWGAT